MKFYFAYGSNMGTAQMLTRCPHSPKLGLAILPGWRWIIASDGYANLVPATTELVEGVLFALAADDETALDVFEEVEAGAYAKLELPVLYEGNTVPALVYVSPRTEEGVAEMEYVLRLQAALVDAGLSADYVARAVSRFIHLPHCGS